MSCWMSCLRRMVVPLVVVVLWIMVSDFIVHGVLLVPAYLETASLWRSQVEMTQNLPVMLAGQFFFGLFFVAVLLMACVSHWCRGATLGFLMGGFLAASTLVVYAVQPIPTGILMAWAASHIGQYTVAGALVGLINRTQKFEKTCDKTGGCQS